MGGQGDEGLLVICVRKYEMGVGFKKSDFILNTP